MSAKQIVPASQQRAFLLSLPEATIKFATPSSSKAAQVWVIEGRTGYWAWKAWCNAITWGQKIHEIRADYRVDQEPFCVVARTLGRAGVFVPAAVRV